MVDEATIIDLQNDIDDIKQELGLIPQGVYADVRVRLDILESRIGSEFAQATDVTNPFFVGNDGVSISTGDGVPIENRLNGSLFLRKDGDSAGGIYTRQNNSWFVVPMTPVDPPPPPVFEFDLGTPSENITSLKSDAAAIDNTKTGIVNAGSDTLTVPSTGVTGNYSTCVGGDMPSIAGDYATGGGRRPNAYGRAGTAFGDSSFANGEGCTCLGKSCVAGNRSIDAGGEKRYATAAGSATQARAEGSTAFGVNCLIDIAASNAFCVGLNSLVGPNALHAVAMGNQSEARGLDSVAIGVACLAGNALGTTGEGAAAIGYHCQAIGDTSVAIGQSCQALKNASHAVGRSCIADGASAFAAGDLSQANNDFSFALGRDCQTTGVSSFGLGQGARTRLYSELQYSGFPSASGPSGAFSHQPIAATSINAAVNNMLTPGTVEIVLEDGRAYMLTIRVVGGRTDAAGTRGRATFEVLAHATGGALTIDAQANTDAATFPLPGGWAVVVSAPAGLTLRIAVNGAAGQTVRFGGDVEWRVVEAA